MTVAVANSLANNTFGYQRARLNELADAMSSKAVTVNSNTATGNAAISGTFTAAKLVANTLDISGGGSMNVATLTANDIGVGLGTFANLTTNVFAALTGSIQDLTSNNITVQNLVANAFTTGSLSITSMTGNAAVFNYLNANTLGTFANLVATNIRTGTISVGNNSVNTQIVAANAAAVSNGAFWLNANGNWGYISPPAAIPGANTQVYFNDSNTAGASAGMTFNKVSNTLTVANAMVTGMIATAAMLAQSNQILLAGTSQQVVDAIPIATFRGAEYTYTLKDQNANNYGMGKVMVLHGGANGAALSVEFATLFTNSAMGAWDASVNSTHLALLYTPVSSSMTATYNKTALVL